MHICLIVMPFSTCTRPALGVSLLKRGLERNGISSRIFYFNLEFAELIGFDTYERLASTTGFPLIGELIFSFFTVPNTKWDIDRWFSTVDDKKFVSTYLKNISFEELKRIYELIPDYIKRCAYSILRERPSLIGFTSTFEQQSASIALAGFMKDEEEVPIIFGGANCEGEMGMSLLKLFHCVDFVCSGEGDLSFIEFANQLRSNSLDSKKIDGILSRKSSSFEAAMTMPVLRMDDLPFPDFDDYFDYYNRSSLNRYFEPQLIIESSRGCWWGEKFQCTFCGLNGLSMKYRSKSVGRVISELKYLNREYRLRSFYVVDNIMDLKYLYSLFPQIKASGLDIELFYETKSNLSRSDLRVMREGGVTAIQPGIESLSTAILQLMKKGVTATRNIELLKWCNELNIVPLWNWLWGFPEEPEDEYRKMTELVPLLTHLYPPEFGRIVLDRFSPYFIEPDTYGICNVRPWTIYNMIYQSAESEQIAKIAYHFDFDYKDGRNISGYTYKLQRELELWQSLWRKARDKHTRPVLCMAKKVDGLIMIKDTRPISTSKYHILLDEEAKVYDLCQTSHSFSSISTLTDKIYPHLTNSSITEILTRFIEKKLMIYADNKYLSLAVPLTS